MLDRSERILKIVCFGLAALLLFQIYRAAIKDNPLANLTIPAVPTLAGTTNNAATAQTNSAAASGGTNSAAASGGTNVAARKELAAGTTIAPGALDSAAGKSNLVAGAEPAREGTNLSARRGPSRRLSNSVPGQADSVGQASRLSIPQADGLIAANLPDLLASTGTGAIAVVSQISTNPAGTSNAVPFSGPGRGGDMLAAGARGARRGGAASLGGMEMAMAAGGRRGGISGPGGPGPALPELPPTAKARVERIYRSELFGAIIQPVPAALIGIAGDSAILRGTNGQTGLVKAGDSLGGLKLLKIGINRVLVEEGGQQKELMIFSGFGGESLMSKPADNLQ
jgi:hypothetical protein